MYDNSCNVYALGILKVFILPATSMLDVFVFVIMKNKRRFVYVQGAGSMFAHYFHRYIIFGTECASP